MWEGADTSPPGEHPSDGEPAVDENEEADLEPEEDEYDPFANEREDPPPEYEGDDRVHEGEQGEA